MKFELEPEVAGGWGEGTVADTSIHPPLVKELVYEFSGWQGDELLETFPCFIVTEFLAEKIQGANLKGVLFDSVKVTKSDQFIEMYPNIDLPRFKWLKVSGSDADDFSLSSNGMLVVSEEALSILKQCSLDNCEVYAAAT